MDKCFVYLGVYIVGGAVLSITAWNVGFYLIKITKKKKNDGNNKTTTNKKN
jgi:hypothetical protein